MTDESKKHRGTLKRTKIGVVISDKRDKTRTIAVNYQIRHPKYGKYVRRKTVCYIHDGNDESHMGDTVEIEESRPLSKTKRWNLLRVVSKSTAVDVAALRAKSGSKN